MEWFESILKVLFSNLGPLGTVCVATTIYAAWLHYKEKEDHKRTRELVAADAEKRNILHQEFISTLVEIKMSLHKGNSHGKDVR